MPVVPIAYLTHSPAPHPLPVCLPLSCPPSLPLFPYLPPALCCIPLCQWLLSWSTIHLPSLVVLWLIASPSPPLSIREFIGMLMTIWHPCDGTSLGHFQNSLYSLTRYILLEIGYLGICSQISHQTNEVGYIQTCNYWVRIWTFTSTFFILTLHYFRITADLNMHQVLMTQPQIKWQEYEMLNWVRI